MFKRKTSRTRKSGRKMLVLHVNTPRILMFRLRDWAWTGFKLVMWLALAGGVVWGVSYGVRRAFIENEDFRLRAVDLNPNRALDERRLVELGKIDLNGSLFAVDPAKLEQELEALPELVDARAERQLPGTLVVRVRERVPVAWLECKSRDIPGRDPERGLLIDPNRVVFPCVAGMREHARNLPVVVLSGGSKTPEPSVGAALVCTELDRCLRLLRKAMPAATAGGWEVDRIEQVNSWSLRLTTTGGVQAVFGLGEHERQLADLTAALDDSAARSRQLATINLIPERNIPITLREAAPPRAIPVDEDFLPPMPPETPAEREAAAPPGRAARDLRDLLNRG